MATARPFTYNSGSLIPGTEKFGNLTVGTPTSGFESTGLQWWNGPDEDLGYVIAQTNVDINGSPLQPSPVEGLLGNVGFFRTSIKDDNLFVNLSNVVTGQNFTSPSEAKTWLESNGYWTSYVDVTTTTTTISGPLYTNFTEYIIDGVRQVTTTSLIRSNITSTRRLIVTHTISIESISLLRIPPSNWTSINNGNLRPTLSIVSGSGATIDGGTSNKQFYNETRIINPTTGRANELDQFDTYIMRPNDLSQTTLTPGEYDLSVFSTGANFDLAVLTNTVFPIDNTRPIHPSSTAATTHFAMEVN
jgi:hypothetical protein